MMQTRHKICTVSEFIYSFIPIINYTNYLFDDILSVSNTRQMFLGDIVLVWTCNIILNA